MNQLDQAKISDRKIKADRDFIQPELITGTESGRCANSPGWRPQGIPPHISPKADHPVAGNTAYPQPQTSVWSGLLSQHPENYRATPIHSTPGPFTYLVSAALCQLTWLETSRNSPTYLSKGRPPCRRQHSLSPASDIGLVRSSVTTQARRYRGKWINKGIYRTRLRWEPGGDERWV